MASVKSNRDPSPADKQAFKDLFYATPLIERGQPLIAELLWVLGGRKNAEHHAKILPEYCYHIFDALRRTFFKGLPTLDDTVRVIDPAGLTLPATAENLKKVLHLDLHNLGRMAGMGMRCSHFFQKEAEPQLEREGLSDLTPEKTEEVLAIIFGQAWVAANREKIAVGTWEELLAEKIAPLFTGWQSQLNQSTPVFGSLAAQVGPEGMIQFSEGFTEGLKGFLDVDGQLVGQTNRSDTYCFLLIAWPEIKLRLEAEPRDTLSDLHEWLLPFMRVGVLPYLDIEQLRDICAPPPSGIGLVLRPLKKASSVPSA